MIKRIFNNIIFRLNNPTCSIDLSVNVSRKLKVGNNCKLGKGCSLSATVALGDNVVVGSYSFLKNITIGNNSMIESGVKVVGTRKGRIIVGKECYIGVNNVLDTSGDIQIGDFVHIAGPSTGLWCHNSVLMCKESIPLNDPNRERYRPTGSIIIESNVYIGGNCTVYPGVKIGHHSIVAPNCAVTKNVEPFTMVGGVPAKLIKRINGSF